ncbi:MAG: hypothetical protein Q9178_004678 [Gyalolechia marmorata]
MSLSLRCLLLLLVTSTSAVTIEISPTPGVVPSTLYYIQKCRDIPPGHCCVPHAQPPNPPPPPAPTGVGRANRPAFAPPAPANRPNKRITFTGLDALDLAAAYANNGLEAGCRGRPKATYAGGGRWRYDVPPNEEDLVIQGGSWVRITPGAPDEGDRGWVEAQGVMGFIWHGGSWFGQDTSPGDRSNLLAAAQAQLGAMGRGNSGLPWVRRLGKRAVDFGKLMMGKEGALEKRTIRSPTKGIVFCTAPKRMMWPDVIEVDGDAYVSDTPQGLVYTNGDGSKVLNYTAIGI